MKKILLSSVLCLICVCFASGALAAEVQPYSSTLIISCNVFISSSGTTIYADASILTNVTSDTLGFSYIRIQELRGSSWVTVKSVTEQYKANGITYSYRLSYAGTAGKVYRATTGFYAEDAGLSDSRSRTSESCSI